MNLRKSKRGMDVTLRVVDKQSHTIDFYFSSTRSTQAVKRFLGEALKSMESWAHPGAINTHKASPYSAAIQIKSRRKRPPDSVHRDVNYLKILSKPMMASSNA